MGIIIGVVSITFILSAIYLKIDGNRQNFAGKFFIVGLAGMVFFAVILLTAIFEK